MLYPLLGWGKMGLSPLKDHTAMSEIAQKVNEDGFLHG